MSELLHNSIMTGQLYIHKLPSGIEFLLDRGEALSRMALGWSGIRVATAGDEFFIEERMMWIDHLDCGRGA